MQHRPRASNTPCIFSESLQRRLNMYALAASAAGASLLASAQPSQAKVVYTKTHQFIGTNGIYPLDLNHDGTIDFLIQELGFPVTTSGSASLLVKEALGNAVEGSNGKLARRFAARLKKGAPIGRGESFTSGGLYGEIMAAVRRTTASSGSSGQWLHVNHGYLGLKFKIRGKTHYGWARLIVQGQGLYMTATLTGYAYETIARRGILAGQTGGKADDFTVSTDPERSHASGPGSAVAEPVMHTAHRGSLGALARGIRAVRTGRQS